MGCFFLSLNAKVSFCHWMPRCPFSSDQFSSCCVFEVWWSHSLGWYHLCRHKKICAPFFQSLVLQHMGFSCHSLAFRQAPSLSLAYLAGIFHSCVCSAVSSCPLRLFLLLPKNGLLHLCYSIYAESCHINVEVFNEVDQHTRVSNTVADSQAFWL